MATHWRFDMSLGTGLGALRGFRHGGFSDLVEALFLELGLRPGESAVIDRDGQTFQLPYVADPGVVPRTAWLPLRLPGFDVRQLMMAGRSVTNVLVRQSGNM